MMELEQNEGKGSGKWTKAEMYREGGGRRKGGGTTRISPDSQAGRGRGIVIRARNKRGWVRWGKIEEDE